MNSSLTVFRNHSQASRAQLMLVQSSISRTTPWIDAKSLLAAAVAPAFMFSLAILMENSAAEHSDNTVLSAGVSASATDRVEP